MSFFRNRQEWDAFKQIHNLTTEQIEDLREISTKHVASDGIIALLASLYGSISIIAVVGNLLVLFVVVFRKVMQTVTNIFIANLAFADVILGLFAIPFQFQSAIVQRWTIAEFMCKVAPFVKCLCVNVSVSSLTVIAIDRYIAVIYPLRAGFKNRTAIIILLVIWFVSIGATFPEAIYYKTRSEFSIRTMKQKTICFAQWPKGNFYIYYCTLLFFIQYIIPLFIIMFSYIRITHRIWSNDPSGISACVRRDCSRNRNKKKVVKMLILVVTLFAVCWLPLQIYNVLTAFLRDKLTSLKYIHIVWLCSNWLAMSNACYNPFIYGLLNEKFKREFKSLLTICTFCSHNGVNKCQNNVTEMTSQLKNSIRSNRSDFVYRANRSDSANKSNRSDSASRSNRSDCMYKSNLGDSAYKSNRTNRYEIDAQLIRESHQMLDV